MFVAFHAACSRWHRRCLCSSSANSGQAPSFRHMPNQKAAKQICSAAGRFRWIRCFIRCFIRHSTRCFIQRFIRYSDPCFIQCFIRYSDRRFIQRFIRFFVCFVPISFILTEASQTISLPLRFPFRQSKAFHCHPQRSTSLHATALHCFQAPIRFFLSGRPVEPRKTLPVKNSG